jgi:diguanylate cyclase (GGDEF)-like protein
MMGTVGEVGTVDQQQIHTAMLQGTRSVKRPDGGSVTMMKHGHLHAAISRQWQALGGGALPPLEPLDDLVHLHELVDAYGDQLGLLLACTLLAAQETGDARVLAACAAHLSELTNHQDQRDSLTGLLNHAASWEALTREHALALRHGRSLALALLDLADFKAVNDTRGHLNGDQVLVRIAELLGSNVRQTDIVGRIGGDEFLVALVDADAEAAQRLIIKLQAHVQPLRDAGVVPETFALTWGIDDSLEGGPRAMFQRAERQLYARRNQHVDGELLHLPRLRVLVTEPLSARRQDLCDQLAKRGYEPFIARTGPGALKVLGAHEMAAVVIECTLLKPQELSRIQIAYSGALVLIGEHEPTSYQVRMQELPTAADADRIADAVDAVIA